ncbi:MAG: TonB-dependent receptor [bacterium]|nr:TonB-dependent receptor [bacterium]
MSLILLCPGLANALSEVSSSAETAGFMSSVSDTVVVSARALGNTVNPSAAGMITVVDLSEETGNRDLADILGSTAGFQIRRYGGLGFAAVPSLRGSSAAQIRIFIDGLPVDDAQSGAVDLSLLPAERFERAEIHRGVVPGGLGGLGGAGSVNLITRKRTEGLKALVNVGSFGQKGGRLTWGKSSSNGLNSVLLMAHGRRADNNYKYLDNNQTFDNSEDDTTRTRENSWFEEYGFWGKGNLSTRMADLSFVAGFFRKDGGRPGPINYPSPDASVRLDRSDAQLQISMPAQLNISGSTTRVEQFLYDPENQIDDGFGGDIRSLSHDLTGRISWEPTLWTSESSLISSLDLTAGFERRTQWYEQWYGASDDPRRNRETDSFFAALQILALSQKVHVIPAWKYQVNTDDFPALPALPWLPEEEGVEHQRHDVSPSLGLVWEVVPDAWFVEGHVGQSVRIPTWVELFGHRGGIDGNRELQPEEISTADVALVWHPSENSSMRLAAFVAETGEAIVFTQNSPGTSRAQNIGATRNHGLEAEGIFSLPGSLLLQANATVQDPVDDSIQPHLNGKSLPYLSNVEMDLRLSRTLGLWRPWLECSFESEKYRDRANTELIKAEARTLWNAGLGWVLGPELEIFASVINLTNNQSYDIMQFPLPGRTWQMALRVNP